MAPNSEDSTRISQFPFVDDGLNKEKQRPPIYNPEDYAISLKKWGRKSPNGAGAAVGGGGGGVGMISLYSNASNSDLLDCNRSQSNSFRDYRNPMLTTSSGSEMTLRQFGTVSELLAKLKADLRLAYPSFVQEFVGDPLDGITLLLDLLRAIQLCQSNNNNHNNGNGTPGCSNTTGKVPPSVQRRALLDELSCLQCIYNCCARYTDAIRKLTASSAGLFTLAICIMSNVNKSRIIALQLLTKACDPHSNNGHTAVSEALSTLRLRFGEPVRFRFLVGMLTSAGGQKELLLAGMRFLNRFLDTSGSQQKRLYIQAELEQAGFDITVIKKNIGPNLASDQIFEELDHWEKHHIDIETLTIRIEDTERENDSLRDKILLLERRVQILQEEKGVLMSLEQCLKERCSELEGEVMSLKSENKKTVKGGSTPVEDEGISSSERSLTPENEQQRDASVYELYSMQSETIPLASNKEMDNNTNEEDEETTIDEVIEELRNIINDAETEVYVNEASNNNKNKMDSFEDELEIVPSNLHPQPPRRTRSLVHLFVPTEDYDYCHKELFFENETAYTSEESSDSLLSASKCHLPRIEKENKIVRTYETNQKRRTNSKTSIKRSESFRHVTKQPSYYMQIEQKPKQTTNNRNKSKSLDRIDDGLDTMVDIVVTDQKIDKKYTNKYRTRSDSENVTLSRSVSNILGATTKLSCHSDEKQRMFLPTHRDHTEIPYYFPRIQERKCNNSNNSASSFLIRRGHTNAGLYSGQILHEPDNSVKLKKTTKGYISPINSCKMNGKLTDLPSGLY